MKMDIMDTINKVISNQLLVIRMANGDKNLTPNNQQLTTKNYF